MRRVPPHLNGLSGSLRETLRPPNQFSVVPGNRLAAPLRSAPSSHRREPPFSFRPSTTRGRIRWGDAQKRSAIAEHAEAERELALLALLEEGDWYEPSRMQAKVVQDAITRSRSKMRALSKLHKPMVASRAKNAAAEAAAEAAVAHQLYQRVMLYGARALHVDGVE